MTKDLFVRLFHRYSRWDYGYFYSNFIERLPYRFLEGALIANPSVEACTGFGELHDLFSSETGRRWKNPELYPFLNYLMIPSFHALQESIDALRVHVGLAELMVPQANIRRFWRLRDPNVQTFEVRDGQLVAVEEICERTSHNSLVYKPHPCLFSDLNGKVYRGDGYGGDCQTLVDLTGHAIKLITRYSPEIARSFSEEIATIAYVPKVGNWTGGGGFSLRNYYIGGIFVSISDPIDVAEQFLHEYYHQRIWPWWMIEKPADLPSNDVTIVSPVTGRLRPASVMIHALLIYCSLADYYEFVLSFAEPGEFGEQSIDTGAKRLKQIQAGILPLVRRLQEALISYPKSLEIVEYLVSHVIKSQHQTKDAIA